MSKLFRQRRLLMRLPVIVVAIFIISGFESCTFMNDLLGLRPRSIPLGDYSYAIEHTDRLVRRTMRKLDIPGVAPWANQEREPRILDNYIIVFVR